jgi:hypothetical protein
MFVHQNNSIGFCYSKNTLRKEKFIEYQNQFDPQSIIRSDPYHSIHVVKNGIYNIDNQDNIFTYCSPKELYKIYSKSEDLYGFLMQNLFLNFFKIENCISYYSTHTFASVYAYKIQNVSTTYYGQLDATIPDYYKIYVRGQFQPIYLQQTSKLVNENGEVKNIIDLVHQMGKRRILGVDHNHQIVEMEIDRVKNISYLDDESTFQTPFYAIGFIRKSKQPSLILMDQVLVELD